MLFPIIAILAGLTSSPAEAGVHVDVTVPGVHIVFDPWSPAYVPAPRPGYVWIPGFFDAWGSWHPGHWRPVEVRPGYVWVDGYWVGPQYIEGYWRPTYRAGYSWIDGYYYRGTWYPGRWATPSEYARHRAYDARDRAEDRADHAEDMRDRREDYYDRMEDRTDRNPYDREDVRDRAEDRTDRAEDSRDRREDSADRRR